MKNTMLILISTILLITSCTVSDVGDVLVNCDESIKLGDLTVSNYSKSLLPYNRDNILVFENENGDTETLSFSLFQSQPIRLEVEELCRGGGFDKQITYYDSDYFHYIMKSDDRSVYIDLSVSVRAANDKLPAEEIFFDYFLLIAHIERSTTARISMATNKRGHDESVLSPYYSIDAVQNHYTSIDLLGQTFTNVIATPEAVDQAQIFVQADKGVIGYKKADGEIWILKEVK